MKKVIFLCTGNSSPVFPGDGESVQHPFDDHPLLAREARDEEELLLSYNRVRDEIRSFVSSISLGDGP